MRAMYWMGSAGVCSRVGVTHRALGPERQLAASITLAAARGRKALGEGGASLSIPTLLHHTEYHLPTIYGMRAQGHNNLVSRAASAKRVSRRL